MMRSVEKFLGDFKKLDSSSIGVMFVRTDEPYKVGEELHLYLQAKGSCEYIEWTQVNGFYGFDLKNKKVALATDKERNLIPALQYIDERKNPNGVDMTVVNMIWPHYQYNPLVVQKLYEISKEWTSNSNKRRMVIAIPHSINIPKELVEIPVIELNAPTMEEIKEELDKSLMIVENANADLVPQLSEVDELKILNASVGFTASEAYQTYRRIIIEQKTKLPNWDMDEVLSSIHKIKAEALKKSNLLTLGKTVDMADVGGLENLKEWVRLRKPLFSKEAKEFGINPPRGISLVGPPGTGKSLVSKAIAKDLNLSLIVFDIGKCFNSLVGKTEENMREALHTIKSLAPVVVLLDEFDKVFGSGESNVQTDSGISQRIFGTLLNFMQECEEDIFFIASLNRTNGIKPEFFRKGRLDETWCVTLPTEDERREIINIHLRKRNKPEFKGKPMDKVINATIGFTASELEAGINEALIKAFNTKGKKVTPDIVVECMNEIIPNSVAFKESFDRMQEWAEQNARPAGKGMATAKATKSEPGKIQESLDLKSSVSLDS